jgi:hypothetical protein
MQFGALGSTVHGPEVTINLSVSGGGGGGDGGGHECEHTRQPETV